MIMFYTHNVLILLFVSCFCLFIPAKTIVTYGYFILKRVMY